MACRLSEFIILITSFESFDINGSSLATFKPFSVSTVAFSAAFVRIIPSDVTEQAGCTCLQWTLELGLKVFGKFFQFCVKTISSTLAMSILCVKQLSLKGFLNLKFSKSLSTISQHSILSDSRLRGALEKSGIKSPTKIQQLILAHLSNRKSHNFILHSPTGTGKTLAFLLFLFSKLTNHKSLYFPDALIIVPNHDLAIQTLQFANDYGTPLGLTSALLENVDFQKTLALASILKAQRREYQKENGSLVGYSETVIEPDRFPKSNLLITTIGKLAQHDFKKIRILLPRISHFVFDEIDCLLDGQDKKHSWQLVYYLKQIITDTKYVNTVQSFIGCCATLPKHFHQNDFLSSLVVVSAQQPKEKQLEARFERLKSGPQPNEICIPAKIEHQFIQAFIPTAPPEKDSKSLGKIEEQGKNEKEAVFSHKLELFTSFLENNVLSLNGIRVLVFFNSLSNMEKVFEHLFINGYTTSIKTIRSSTSDAERQQILQHFCSTSPIKTEFPQILFCTDLVARGIDFKNVNLVVNFDLPAGLYEYAHRAGRTGRMSKEGKGK